MSLIQELIHLDINNLKIQYVNFGEDSYSFVLITTTGKIVAFGWHEADQFEDKEYSFKGKKDQILANSSSIDLMTMFEWYIWPGFIFLITNRNIWHAEFNMPESIGFKHNTLDLFIKKIKFNFPELRSESVISDEKVNADSIESIQAQSNILLKSAKIEELQNQVLQLSIENTLLKKKLKNLGERIPPENENL